MDTLTVRILDEDEDTLKIIQILNLIITNINSVRTEKLTKLKIFIKPGSVYSKELFQKHNLLEWIILA